MKAAIHPSYSEVKGALRPAGITRFTDAFPHQQKQYQRRNLLGLPSVLYGQAETNGHRRSYRAFPPSAAKYAKKRRRKGRSSRQSRPEPATK